MATTKITGNVTNITSGPSKMDLMLSLFDHKPVRRHVILRGKHESYSVLIDSISIEDGSGESWLFAGQARRTVGFFTPNPPYHKVSGHYRTDTRKGHMEFLD